MSYTTNISVKNITTETLSKAATIRAEIDKLERQLAELFSGQAVASVRVPGRRGRPPKSATASAAPVVPRAKRKRRQLSPEARARIVAAVKARWARAKGNAKK